jgi:hypothetical protein
MSETTQETVAHHILLQHYNRTVEIQQISFVLYIHPLSLIPFPSVHLSPLEVGFEKLPNGSSTRKIKHCAT